MHDYVFVREIKQAIRISHDYLDNEIYQSIDVAQNEMIRAGIADEAAHDIHDPLVRNAIKTYCKYAFANDSKMAEGYLTSWKYQLENMRKTAKYTRSDFNV